MEKHFWIDIGSNQAPAFLEIQKSDLVSEFVSFTIYFSPIAAFYDFSEISIADMLAWHWLQASC